MLVDGIAKAFGNRGIIEIAVAMEAIAVINFRNPLTQ
jgi:hypothetical protein